MCSTCRGLIPATPLRSQMTFCDKWVSHEITSILLLKWTIYSYHRKWKKTKSLFCTVSKYLITNWKVWKMTKHIEQLGRGHFCRPCQIFECPFVVLIFTIFVHFDTKIDQDFVWCMTINGFIVLLFPYLSINSNSNCSELKPH